MVINKNDITSANNANKQDEANLTLFPKKGVSKMEDQVLDLSCCAKVKDDMFKLEPKLPSFHEIVKKKKVVIDPNEVEDTFELQQPKSEHSGTFFKNQEEEITDQNEAETPFQLQAFVDYLHKMYNFTVNKENESPPATVDSLNMIDPNRMSDQEECIFECDTQEANNQSINQSSDDESKHFQEQNECSVQLQPMIDLFQASTSYFSNTEEHQSEALDLSTQCRKSCEGSGVEQSQAIACHNIPQSNQEESPIQGDRNLKLQAMCAYFKQRLREPFRNFEFIVDDSLKDDYSLENYTDHATATVRMSREKYDKMFVDNVNMRRTFTKPGNPGPSTEAPLSKAANNITARQMARIRDGVRDIEAYLVMRIVFHKLSILHQHKYHNMFLLQSLSSCETMHPTN